VKRWISLQGKNIAEVLGMTVEEAYEFFRNVDARPSRLQTLLDVGLGYITLGQSATTLSEANRSASSFRRSSRAARPDGPSIFLTNRPPACILPTRKSCSIC